MTGLRLWRLTVTYREAPDWDRRYREVVAVVVASLRRRKP